MPKIPSRKSSTPGQDPERFFTIRRTPEGLYYAIEVDQNHQVIHKSQDSTFESSYAQMDLFLQRYADESLS